MLIAWAIDQQRLGNVIFSSLQRYLKFSWLAGLQLSSAWIVWFPVAASHVPFVWKLQVGHNTGINQKCNQLWSGRSVNQPRTLFAFRNKARRSKKRHCLVNSPWLQLRRNRERFVETIFTYKPVSVLHAFALQGTQIIFNYTISSLSTC